MSFSVHQMAVLQDNYQHVIVCSQSRQAAVIDPANVPLLFQLLKREKWTLQCVLNTHHHWDHTEGNVQIVERLGIPVYVGRDDLEKTPAASRMLADGDVIEVGELKIRALHIPGHTLGQMGFLVEDAFFSGDTLFSAGCGRIFEGTPEMMWNSLQKILLLPPATRLFCGHEYTVSNLTFAAQLEPDNPDIPLFLSRAQTLRNQGLSTVPSTLAEEKLYNPFLRVGSAGIRQSLSQRGYEGPWDDVSVFAEIRRIKDVWKIS